MVMVAAVGAVVVVIVVCGFLDQWRGLAGAGGQEANFGGGKFEIISRNF